MAAYKFLDRPTPVFPVHGTLELEPEPQPPRCRRCGVPLVLLTLCAQCAKEEIIDLDLDFEVGAYDFDEYAAEVDRIVEEAGLRAFWD